MENGRVKDVYRGRQKSKVYDLLLGIIVQSGNDASIALAEGISGSEEIFAIEMNNLGKKIGLTETNFTNSSGWPDDNHYTTAEDLAKIASTQLKIIMNYIKCTN